MKQGATLKTVKRRGTTKRDERMRAVDRAAAAVEMTETEKRLGEDDAAGTTEYGVRTEL